MTRDTLGYEQTSGTVTQSTPLCLVHYFAERPAYPLEREPHPPGGRAQGWVVERRDNLIILEFAPPPALAGKRRGIIHRKGGLVRVCDALLLLLLLASAGACVAAFRF